MALLSVEERKKRLQKQYDSQMNNDIKKSNAVYKKQSDTVADMYGTEIKNAGEEYQKVIDQNAVQKLINEREIAANMASMGLTDSGLNLTQQTAAQLSYANQNSETIRQKKKYVASLKQAMLAKQTDIETNRANAELGIRQGYDSMILDSATKSYNADVAAEQKREEANQKMNYNIWKARLNSQKAAKKKTSGNKKKNIINESNGKLSHAYQGSLADNNVYVTYGPTTTTYEDKVTGKKISVPRNVNPYTLGSPNPDTEYGTFENGYQPDNVKGEKLKAAKDIDGDTAKIMVNGRTQTVWECSTGYYIWDGQNNIYEKLSSSEALSLGLTKHSGYKHSYH